MKIRPLFIFVTLVLLCCSLCCYGQDSTSTTNVSTVKVRGRTSAPTLSSTGNAVYYFDKTSGKLKVSQNGGAYGDMVGGGGGGGTPGGSTTQVQFNDAGSFGGDAGLVYNKTTNFLTVTGGGITLSTSTINKVTVTPPATGSTLTIQDGFTLTVSGNATVSGTNTGDQTTVSGNAGTATALATARAINGVNFDGTAAITVTAAAGTLSGSTLASGVTASSLTSFGNSPALVTPNLGTPTALVLTNATGLPPATGIVGWPANASGVLTNNGAGTLSWAAGGGISGLTTGTVPMAASSTTIADSIITQASSLVGVNLGATAPPTTFTVGDTGSGNPRGILGWQASADAGSSQLGLRKSRGTFASPAVVVTGDNIGRIRMEGHDGTSYVNSANIIFGSTGTIGTGRVPGTITFQVLPDVASPVLASVLTLTSSGIAATGLDIKSNATGGGVTLTALDSGSNSAINLIPKGTGNVLIGITDAATSILAFNGVGAGNVALRSNSGVLEVVNGANNAYGTLKALALIPTTLMLGGTTSSFAAARTSSAVFEVILADSSNYAQVRGLAYQLSTDLFLARNAAGVLQIGTAINNASGSWLATNGTLSGAFINSGITADTAHTDTSVCQDTTTHQFYSGTATLGACLGTSTDKAKRDITAVDSGLASLMQLKPISFRYKEGWGYPPEKTYYGFTAQQVRPILPNLAGVNDKGEPLNVDLLGMVPLLVQALQEQQLQINALHLQGAQKEKTHVSKNPRRKHANQTRHGGWNKSRVLPRVRYFGDI